MKLEKDKQYQINVLLSNSSLEPGIHLLYFQEIYIGQDGMPIFNFSENLSYNSKFYNLFYPYDIFTISR